MKTVGFVGLGLIGGSIAKTIRRIHPKDRILAYNRSKDALADAMKAGVVDVVCEEKDARFSECDIIFLCAPVEYNLACLKDIYSLLKPTGIITDVGSVKSVIHAKVEEWGMGDRFIGGHPMAGSEKTGFANSTDRLIENAYYILSPASGVSLSAVGEFSDYIRSLGAIPLLLSCEEHDFVTAGVSHLPHIIASSLVNLIKNLDSPQEYMKKIAAGGFRDITRIASSSSVMWQQICEENQKNISLVLDEYIRMLIQIRYELDAGNSQYIYDMFDSSREYRDSIDVTDGGGIGMAYNIYVDLADEAGGIATITTILAMDGISIKNLGIIHNREFSDGVLKIEFYDAESMERGKGLLKKRNYRMHQR